MKDLAALLNAQQQLLEAAHGRAKEREVELTRRAQDQAELRQELQKMRNLLAAAVKQRDELKQLTLDQEHFIGRLTREAEGREGRHV